MDRITILWLKSRRLRAEAGRLAADMEAKELEAILAKAWIAMPDKMTRLSEVNTTLWELEDAMRAALAAGSDADIADLSRKIVDGNAERARIKAEINRDTGSAFFEYKDYGTKTPD